MQDIEWLLERENMTYRKKIFKTKVSKTRERERKKENTKVCNMMNKSSTSDVILLQACK